MKQGILFFVFGIVLGVNGLAQLPKPLPVAVLDSIAKQDVPRGAPGIATAIIHKGKLVYAQTAGYANLKDSIKIDADTRFNIASNGKQFTALTILLLEHQGKLRLDQDVRTILPDVFTHINTPISIEQLLHHTSGVRDVYDLWSLQGITWWQQSYRLADALALLSKQSALNFSPGTKYRYSNSNYILLAAVVEQLTQKSFAAFTKDIFMQLGMRATAFEDQQEPISGVIAKAYFNFGSWTTYDWKWRIVGDGNCFSSLRDQIRWEQILQGAVKTRIPAAVIQKSQYFSQNQSYGFGLEQSVYKNLPYLFHEGATGAWKATTLRFPTQQTAMITLTNTGKSIPAMQTRQMADVLFGLPRDAAFFVTQPTSSVQQFTEQAIQGIYTNDDGFSFQFLRKGTAIYLRRMGRNDIQLQRKNGHVWQQANDTAFQLAFDRSQTGAQTVTAYYTTHAPYSLTKIEADWTGHKPEGITGVFNNTETDVRIAIEHTGDYTYRVIINGDTSKGILLKPGLLKVNGYQLLFTKDAGDDFLLNGERISAVLFKRKKDNQP